MLLGLYRGIFIYHEISPGDIHRWRKKGILIQEIKRIYENYPAEKRGGYYPWFLENQYLLDPKWKEPADPGLPLMRRTWESIGGDPAITSGHKDVIETWPVAKQSCFWLYHLAFHGWHPNPDADAWVDFGFCVCRAPFGEGRLANIYTKIIVEHRCPLEEFAAAYESYTLFSLFRKHGLESEARRIKYLGNILNQPSRESMWDLKQWVYAEKRPPINSIRVDYGIANCWGIIDQIQLLKATYKRVFEHPDGEPMELHQACIRGEIFLYVDGLLKLKKREAKVLRGLMKNLYLLQEY